MWWLLAIFGGAFLYGITRPRYTVKNYYENDGYVETNCECSDGDSYRDGGRDD
jgi:hypothetical protein